jgi:phosphorylcholine metabolism protein LicD
MGYKHSYDIIEALRQIQAAYRECSDPRNDGFISWGIKQDLYQLKWELDRLLDDCPSFAPENEWLREQEKKKVLRYLKDDIQ